MINVVLRLPMGTVCVGCGTAEQGGARDGEDEEKRASRLARPHRGADLQREFHTARQRAAQPHAAPVLSAIHSATAADIPSIRQALAATRHILEMYRRGLSDEKTRRGLQRLDRRLLDVAVQLDRITTAEK